MNKSKSDYSWHGQTYCIKLGGNGKLQEVQCTLPSSKLVTYSASRVSRLEPQGQCDLLRFCKHRFSDTQTQPLTGAPSRVLSHYDGSWVAVTGMVWPAKSGALTLWSLVLFLQALVNL
jgi:hypothetical protein